MSKLSVIIPARNEPYLDNTILDVLKNSTRDTDVYAILDGYDTQEIKDPRVHYIRIPLGDGLCHMRQGINKAVEMTQSKFVMKLDAHCSVSKGFDDELIKAHQFNWVQIPRRKRLDVKKWEVIEDGRPPIDYEFIVFQNLMMSLIWGTTWEELTRERAEILIDDTPHFQGSCFFMAKDWFIQNGFLDLKFGGWGYESEEIHYGTLKAGGRVVTNKNAYYAHLHKDKEAREWFTLKESEYVDSANLAYKTWVKDHKELFIKHIENFPPMPGWPTEWRKII